MFAHVIDGLNARLKQAIAAGDYEEVRLVDLACVRFMNENLPPPQGTDAAELQAVMDSLARLSATYGEARDNCTAARNDLQQALQTAGHNRRNTLRYLDVARNLG